MAPPPPPLLLLLGEVQARHSFHLAAAAALFEVTTLLLREDSTAVTQGSLSKSTKDSIRERLLPFYSLSDIESLWETRDIPSSMPSPICSGFPLTNLDDVDETLEKSVVEPSGAAPKPSKFKKFRRSLKTAEELQFWKDKVAEIQHERDSFSIQLSQARSEFDIHRSTHHCLQKIASSKKDEVITHQKSTASSSPPPLPSSLPSFSSPSSLSSRSAPVSLTVKDPSSLITSAFLPLKVEKSQESLPGSGSGSPSAFSLPPSTPSIDLTPFLDAFVKIDLMITKEKERETQLRSRAGIGSSALIF